MPKCSIVIPQKGNDKMTRDLVNSLRVWESGAQIVVIHDHHEKIDPIPGATVELNRSYGVTAAWNHGCELASGDWLIVMNNDVICSCSFVDLLISNAGSGVSGVGGRKEQMIGAYSEELPGGKDSEWVQGWCFCFHRDLFDDLIGFDESMKYYFSDLDFQVRAKLKGMPITPVSCQDLWHIGHATAKKMPDKRALWVADREAFVKKIKTGEFSK
jgi:GT2 family glycosyltransferase